MTEGILKFLPEANLEQQESKQIQIVQKSKQNINTFNFVTLELPYSKGKKALERHEFQKFFTLLLNISWLKSMI